MNAVSIVPGVKLKDQPKPKPRIESMALQCSRLNYFISKRVSVIVYTQYGSYPHAQITAYDKYTVEFLTSDGFRHLVYKHAMSAIAEKSVDETESL